jgi:hypothetical protein
VWLLVSREADGAMQLLSLRRLLYLLSDKDDVEIIVGCFLKSGLDGAPERINLRAATDSLAILEEINRLMVSGTIVLCSSRSRIALRSHLPAGELAVGV